jgi:hypothetical protein
MRIVLYFLLIVYIYRRGLSKSEYEKADYEHRLKERDYKGIAIAIDNCGNIDFNVQKTFERDKGDMNKGG